MWRPGGGPAGLGAREAGPRSSLASRRRRPTPALPTRSCSLSAEVAAQRFLDWLGTTERRWALVLDGVASAADLDGLWPQGPAGQVVVTSRLARVGARLPERGRDRPGVGGFSRREALGYLNSPAHRVPGPADRGARPGRGRRRAADRARPGGRGDQRNRHHLPGLPGRVPGAPGSTAETLVDGCPPSLLATWSMRWSAPTSSRPRACPGLPRVRRHPRHRRDPGCGAHLPRRLRLHHRAAGYTARGGGRRPGLVRSAYANLERLGLVSVDRASAVRTVWLHPAVRAASRAYLAPGDVEQVVGAAAAALVEAWPEAGAADSDPQLTQALRDCAGALRTFAGDLLWKPEAHPVLLRAGASLAEPPVLTDSAIGYWQAIGAMSSQLLGYGHPQSVQARDRLADAYASSGRLAEAMPVFEAALSDREAAFGAMHPETVTARLNVARSLNAAGRDPEAIALYEQALAARERLRELGTGTRSRCGSSSPPRTRRRAAAVTASGCTSRRSPTPSANWAGPPGHAGRPGQPGRAYLAAGQSREAVNALQRALADRERTAGRTTRPRCPPGPAWPPRTGPRASPRTPSARTSGYWPTGSGSSAPTIPDTIAARGSLGYAYRSAGRMKDAIPQYERVVADRERLLDPATATRSPRGPSSPPLTSRDGGCGKRSRPTSGWPPTASGRSAPGTWTR